ncbi:VOC family protein [Tenggerimyces flavus]|uniref:VOC family protein n=1 Tax=Tenggerimyces flavus TaxID=1708749 RepID=A0ABV7YPK2_9ACTN|nr:VOC family protein [Tenggerimyces flavus]MBM7789354.1 putative enzyme related to lactoylglutathione lyase [Tenggerimyces flavus]
MELTLHYCFITIDDGDQALAFYRDALGLELRNDVAYGGARWLTMGPKTQPDVNIVLETVNADPNVAPEDLEALNDLLAKGLLRAVVLATPDCDATFEQVRSSGAEVIQEPIDQPYGVRDCAFRDPAGNMVRFAQLKG